MVFSKTGPAGRFIPVSGIQPQWRALLIAAGVVALYILSASLGLKLAVVHGNVTAIWPPSGIALAALLLFGSRFWPAVAAGALLLNYSTGAPLAASAGIAAGNTLAALAGQQLVRRAIGHVAPLESVRSLLALLGGGALLATLVSATLGVSVLLLSGLALGSELLPIWLTWWFGDAAGVIIFAPLFLAWMACDISGTRVFAGGSHNAATEMCMPPFSRPHRIVEALLLAASLVFTAQLVFGGWFVTGSENYPLAFLQLPLLIWAGFRFGERGATAAIATMSLLAIWGTVLGYGPFVHADLNRSLLLLQVFMCVNAFTTLMLVAVLKERDAIRQGLQQARNELEQRVDERTRALLEANRFLLDEIGEHRKLQEQVTDDSRHARASASRGGTGLRHMYERISRTVHDDMLRAQPDGAFMSERLETALQYARLAHRKAALLYVGITNGAGELYVHENDSTEGLLQQVAERLQAVLRETDTLARRAESGFVILLEDIRELDDVAAVAERVVHEICIPFVAGPGKTYLVASVGISIFPDDAVDAAQLCERADAAMRLACESGGRKYHFHIQERASIDADISRLIGND